MKKLLVLILVLMMAVPLLAADTAMDSFTADASPDDEGQIIGYDTGVATRWPVSAFQLRDATLTAVAGLTFADKSIIQLTGADAAAVLTCANANMLIGVNAANDALECKSTINVLLDNSAAQFADSVAPTKLVKISPVGNTAGATTTLGFASTADATITFPAITSTLAILGANTFTGNQLMNSTTQFQFGDSGTYINQSANGILNIATDTETKFLVNDEDINLTKTGSNGITIGTNTGTLAITSAIAFNVPIKTVEVDGHTDQTSLTAANVSGTTIYNTGQGAADVFLLLPAAAAGYSFIATVGTAQANYFGVEAAAGDKIYLIAAAGTVAAGDDAAGVVMTAAQIGQSFACWTFKTDAYDWMCKAISIGTSTFAAHAHSTP